MLPYPKINPDLITINPFHIGSYTIGPIHVRWYGVMYVLGFIASYFFIQKQKRSKEIGLVGTVAQDLIFYLSIGVIAGGRLGYILFYEYNDLMPYIRNPLEIIATWHGGMSFHGGVIGCVIAAWIFARRRKMPFLALVDSTVVTAPIGLGLGRLGNFINGELLGRPSDLPWAMIFPAGGPIPRHPSQLYESFAEGVVLFAIMWTLRKKPFRDGMMLVFFLVFYAIFRFIIEFFKEPDEQIGFLLTYLTMGQILCLVMFIPAALLALYVYRDKFTRKQD